MPSPNFTINGSVCPPEKAVAYGAALTFALTSTSGVNTIAWAFAGTDAPTTVPPAITLGGSPLGATATATMVADPTTGRGVSMIIRCVINGGRDSAGQMDPSLTKTALVGVANSVGIVPLAVGEQFERDATFGWTVPLNEALTGSGSGGVTVHANLTGLSADDHPQYLRTDGTRTLTGALAMGAHKITGLATPTATTDAATKAYVDAIVAAPGGAILADGSVPFTGAQSMGSHKLTSVSAPTVSSDAATKGYVDAQIVPAGTNPFTGDQSMGSHKLTNVQAPAAGSDAATKAYVDATIIPAGTNAFTGDQSLGGHKLTSVGAPISSDDAATKAYVDSHAGVPGPPGNGITVHLATAAPLPTNARTGNIITASANGALNVDGVAVVLGDRLLLKNESAGANNGLYSVTATGSVGTPYQLTRTLDVITTGMTVSVTSGAQIGAIVVLTTEGTIAVNATALTFSVVTGSGGSSFIKITVMIDGHVAGGDVTNLSAGPTVWDGYTLLINDQVGLDYQSNSAHIGVATYHGSGIFTMNATQPPDPSQLITFQGTAAPQQFVYTSGAFSAVNAGNAATYVGPNGTVGEQAPDGAGYIKTHLYNRWAAKSSIGAGATVTLFVFDHAAEGLTVGNLDFRARVLWLTNAGSNRAAVSLAWICDATATPANLYVGPHDDIDETSAGAAGTANHVTLAVDISGNTERLRCTNNTGGTINVSSVIEGYLAA